MFSHILFSYKSLLYYNGLFYMPTDHTAIQDELTNNEI